jgi:ubiquinone/menaquinone biosynthesis C-methylase UbiE
MLNKHFDDVPINVIDDSLKAKTIRRQQAAALEPQRRMRTERQFFVEALKHPYPLDAGENNEAFVRQQAMRSKPGKYRGVAPRRIERAIDWFIAKIPGCLRGRTVLDLGARDGHGTMYALQRRARDAVGVEIVPEVATYARDRLHRPIVHGDMRRLPYADSTWDILFALHSLEHVPDPDRAVAEMVRVAKHRSWLLVAVPLESREQANGNPYSTSHNFYWPTAEAFRKFMTAQPGIEGRTVQYKVVRISASQHECRLAVRVQK